MGLRSRLQIRRILLVATSAMALCLALMPGIAQASPATEYYVDEHRNVCVGNESIAPFCNWEATKPTGETNTALGHAAMFSLTTGFGNTASGFNALLLNSSGTGNTANGFGALESNKEDSFNTASGYGAMEGKNEGSRNTAYGAEALHSNTIGHDNTASGYGAM